MPTPLIIERSNLSGVNPSILNITLTDANTEYQFSIPQGTTGFSIKTRISTHTVKVSFTAGQSGAVYFTLDGVSWSEVNIRGNFSLYVQSPNAGCVLEAVIWS